MAGCPSAIGEERADHLRRGDEDAVRVEEAADSWSSSRPTDRRDALGPSVHPHIHERIVDQACATLQVGLRGKEILVLFCQSFGCK